MDYKQYIREVPDFPKEGILFYDITTLLANEAAFQSLIDDMAKSLDGIDFDKILGIEARGFIFASALAVKLHKPFIPVRKKGKLPYKTVSHTYDLEYGQDTIEMHIDAVSKDEKVIVVDDLLATGGTVKAAIELVSKAGAKVIKTLFAIELDFLNGRSKLDNTSVSSIIHY